MAEHNQLGTRGEDLAVNYLVEKGYIILERNWRYGRSKHELDIICRTADGATVVFVEVKTRTQGTGMTPEAAMNRQKIGSLRIAANWYVQMFKVTEQLRFDLVTVIRDTQTRTYTINHTENAFNPLLM